MWDYYDEMLCPIIVDIERKNNSHYNFEIFYSQKQNIKIDKFRKQRKMLSYQLIDAFHSFSA